jgi:CRISPR/Cas system-associated endoribonuclease Cas2
MGQCGCYRDGHYIGLYLEKLGKKYFGWIQLSVQENSVNLSEYAVLESPCDSIKSGIH